MSWVASNGIHHANLLVGTPAEAESYLNLFCEDLGIKLANNPDFFPFRKDTFGIDDARQLSLLSTRKALTNRKIFFITPIHLTLEAQNALLKTFEDPSPDNTFFLVLREEALIVPTLLSRMQIIRLARLNLESKQGSTLPTKQEAEKFLSSSLKNRLVFAKKFLEEEKNLPTFLDNLLWLLRKKNDGEKLVEKVYNLRRLINDSNLAPRLIIEHLSLVLP